MHPHFAGGLDLVTTPEDIVTQLSQVPKTYQVQKEPVLVKSYGHMDLCGIGRHYTLDQY